MTKRLPVLNEGSALDHPDVPIFQEAVLDREGLDCLLADLDDLTEIIEIRVKATDAEALSVAGADLLAARALFLDGLAAGLQILYRFADRTWCDTLLADGEATRLLRLEEPMRVD